MFIKKDVQHAPVTNTFNLSSTENYHNNTTKQPHPKTSLKGINGTHLPAARSQLPQTTPRYEANRKINVNNIDILNDTSTRSNNKFLEISSPADSTPLQPDTEIFSPHDIKSPQFRKKPGLPFITSLVKHNQTPEGRQAVKELLSQAVRKINQVQPIDGIDNEHIQPVLKDKETIKQNCRRSWKPLVARINDNLRSIQIKHKEAIAKDISTNFETSHDALFKAKQKEVRVAQGIQLGISSFFVLVGTAVAIGVSASTFGAASPIAPVIGAAISVMGLGIATYVAHSAFPALWSNRKTYDEQIASEKAKKIGDAIGLRKLPLCKDHINAYTQLLMQSRIKKLEQLEAEINNELKHFTALWHKVCREDKDWDKIHGDLLPAIQQCADTVANKTLFGQPATWALFHQEILAHIDKRLTQLQELQGATSNIITTLNENNQQLEANLAQDLWSIWLMDKAEFVTDTPQKALPIGKPIATELVEHKMLTDCTKSTSQNLINAPDTITPLHQFSQEDVILNPGYSVWQLMSRQIRAQFSRSPKRAEINHTRAQKEHLSRVKRKQLQLIADTRQKFIARAGNTNADKTHTLKLLEAYDKSAKALQELKKNNPTAEALKAAANQKDKMLLTLIRDRVMTQNFDHLLKSLCPTTYKEIVSMPETAKQRAAITAAQSKAIEPLADDESITSETTLEKPLLTEPDY